MTNLKYIGGILLLLLIFIGGVSASDDFNETLSADMDEMIVGNPDEIQTAQPSEDVISDIPAKNKTFDDIQKLVDDSKPNDVIELEGIYISNASQITVPHDLTFTGKDGGAILDAEGLKEAIHSNASSVTLKNIVFKNFYSYQGAIKVTGNVTIINASFENGNGRSCYLVGPNVYLKDVNFECTLSLQGDNLVLDNCTQDIKYDTSSYFISSDSDFAPFQDSNHSSLEIRNSRFKIFQFSIFIYVRQFENISIENSEFVRNNLMCDYVLNCFKTFNMKASRFDACRVEISDSSNSTIKIEECEFANNFGGALDISSEYYLIDGCKFINSTVVDREGGALRISGEGSVENCRFINNTATYGGAIHMVGGGKIINNTFIANKAEEGGAIALQCENITIKNNTFVNNSAKSASCIYNNYYDGKNIVIKDNVMRENHAENGRDTFGFDKIILSQSGKYDGETTLTVKIVDSITNKPVPLELLKDAKLDVYQYGKDGNYICGKKFQPVKVMDGVLVFNIRDVYYGNLNATSKFTASLHVADNIRQIQMTIERPRLQFKATGLTLTARSNDSIDLWFYSPGKIILFPQLMKTTVKIYKGSKLVRTYDVDVVTLWGHQFSAGTYKIVATAKSSAYIPQKFPKTLTLKVNKMKTTVKAAKVTAKYKKSKYFTIIVKQKNKSPVTQIIKIKVKIGKKTYNLKTNKKGVVKFNTKSLNVGKHAVTITSGDSNYEIRGKSTITIKR